MSSRFVGRIGVRWVGVVAIGWTSLAWAGGKDDVEEAVGKSYSAKSYSWASQVSDQPDVHAKTEPDGYTSVLATVDGKPRVVVVQGTKGAVQTEAGWKTAGDLERDAPQRRLASWLEHFEKLPVMEIGLTLHDVPTMQATGGGQYAGQVTERGVIDTLGEFRKGTTVTDGHGTLTVTLKDGFITHSELHLTGTVTTKTGSKAVDRKEIFSFSDYDATKPDVPDGAKQALAKQ